MDDKIGLPSQTHSFLHTHANTLFNRRMTCDITSNCVIMNPCTECRGEKVREGEEGKGTGGEGEMLKESRGGGKRLQNISLHKCVTYTHLRSHT